MNDSKAMSFAILMADAFGRPTTDGIDDVGWAFNGTEAVTQAVSEGVDDTSIRHPWFQPFIERRTCRVGISSMPIIVTWECKTYQAQKCKRLECC